MNDHVNDSPEESTGKGGWMVPGLLGPYGHQPDVEPGAAAKPEAPAAPAEPVEQQEEDAP